MTQSKSAPVEDSRDIGEMILTYLAKITLIILTYYEIHNNNSKNYRKQIQK